MQRVRPNIAAEVRRLLRFLFIRLYPVPANSSRSILQSLAAISSVFRVVLAALRRQVDPQSVRSRKSAVNVRPPLDPSPFLESAPTPVPSENLIHRWPRDAVRYSFIVSDFHRLLLASLPAHRESNS